MNHRNPSEQNHKEQSHKDYQIDDTFEKNVCSATEMTGLIPALPEDEDELRNYEELYRYLPDPARMDGEDGRILRR